VAALFAVVAATALVVGNRDATATTGGVAPRAHTGPAAPRTVTLVTGDRVTVSDDGDGDVTVEPGEGRAAMTFRTGRSRGHVTVVPADAMGLLAAGRLDPRLFDVTTLLADGYDDRRPDLPLIVSGAKPASAGVRVGRALPRFGGTAVRQDRRQPGAFWRTLTGGAAAPRALAGGVTKVWLDGRRRPTLDVSVPQIGAPAAWAAGYTGTGVTVAVLDSGIDGEHPDLAGKVAARVNFTEGVEDDRDLTGHGTHVASTIAGNGSRYRGVAPDARLLDGKVCVVDGCAESWILAGMEWAAAEQHAKVVNLSLGGFDSPDVDPIEAAVDALSQQYGTLFVIAAGNDGTGGVNSPGSADAALTVGAVDRADRVADFSSRGPRVGDGAIKPDVTAPGVAITAARGADSDLPGDAYTALSGTSMATPHVAGAAALLSQRHPDWPGARLKSALMGSARPTAGVDAYAQGAGRVDVATAIGRTVTASPPSLSFGTQLWPHTDDAVLTRNVVYHNAGDAAVTLALTVDAGSSGAGTFTVDPAGVTVPAGGDATVTVTADTRVSGPDGRLTGALVATGAGQSVRTPLAVEREIESYTVTTRPIGPDGAPASVALTAIIAWDSGNEYQVDRATGVIRLPRGRYTVSGTILAPETPESGVALLVQPALDVTGDRTVVLDARRAVRSSVTVPEASASQAYAGVGFTIRTAQVGLVESGLFSNAFDNIATANVGDGKPAAGFMSNISGVWAQRDAQGRLLNSPYTYAVRYHRTGTMLAGFHHAVARSELATVRATYHAGNDPRTGGSWFTTPRLPGQETHASAVIVPFTLPFTVVRYYNSDGGVQWRQKVYESWEDGNGNGCLCGWTADRWTRYTAGRTYPQAWIRGVFGPVLPDLDDPTERGVTRTGDTIAVDLPLYGDGAGRSGNSGDSGTTSLFRDGVLVGDEKVGGSGTFVVPPGEAGYRLLVHSRRGAPYALSTAVDAEWTFRSGHVDAAARLPLWTVRFAPEVDPTNAVPAGRPAAVPVTAVPAPGAKVGRLADLRVEVSVDDGATWSPVPVANGVALVPHPAGGGFVSLRATARDTAGNGVRLTVVHAYRYGSTAG
jgi:subtilisin family serine protease